MIELDAAQLEAWMTAWFWPFVRLGACFTAAPIFGARFVPVRLRIGLAAVLTIMISPLLPAPPAVPLLSVEGLLITAQQVLIGVATGFLLQLVFDAIGLAGQLLANSMGLSFAFNVDPARGAATPAVGQIYLIVVTMGFVALDGHVALIEALVQGFRTLPIGSVGLGADALATVVRAATNLFSGAVGVALPGMTALLIANLAFGVISRAAPTLNLIAVGFPITLVFGLAIVVLCLPAVQAAFSAQVALAFETIGRVLLAGGR